MPAPWNFRFLFILVAFSSTAAATGSAAPTPTPWPERFHALLYTNLSSFTKIRVDDLWYDWPNRRSMLAAQQQLSDLLYDVEWGNGTSFYFTLGAHRSCRTEKFPVGIVRPDFLQTGTVYLGRVYTDGFLCDLWKKLDFIWYYEDVATRRPVRWDFYDGISMHVMTFVVGAVLDGSYWQAPAYCFDGEVDEEENARSGGFTEMYRRLRFLNHGGGDDLHFSPA